MPLSNFDAVLWKLKLQETLSDVYRTPPHDSCVLTATQRCSRLTCYNE